MALYVDDAIWAWHGLRWCHLLADGVDELHRFAAELGIQRISYQGPPKTGVPHYDLTAFERRLAIARGAVACSRHEIVAVSRRIRPIKQQRPESNRAATMKPEEHHAQDLGAGHIGQRAEGDVGDRRARAAS